MHFSASTFMAIYWHQFSKENALFVLFGTNFNFTRNLFNIMITKIDTKIAPPKGAILEKIKRQHQHQRKKAIYLMPNLHFFGANKVQI